MNYSVKSTEIFERQTRRLIKKYASLKKELYLLVQELKENPKQGTPIGKSCLKFGSPLLPKEKEILVAPE